MTTAPLNPSSPPTSAPADALAPSPPRARLAAEFAAIFVALPIALCFLPPRGWLIPLILVGGLASWLLLRADRTFDRQQFFIPPGGAARRHLPTSLALFALAAAVLTAFTLLVIPERFLSFPRQNPTVWATVMLLYPLLSALPQELIFRTFLFHRYTPIFPTAGARIAASAAAFAGAHAFLNTVIAVVFSLLGGLIFAWTYHRSRSTMLVWLEHALYGCLAFTIGLGWYFYAGAQR